MQRARYSIVPPTVGRVLQTRHHHRRKKCFRRTREGHAWCAVFHFPPVSTMTRNLVQLDWAVRSLASAPSTSPGCLASLTLAGLGLTVLLLCWCFGWIRSCFCRSHQGRDHRSEESQEKDDVDDETESRGKLQALFEVACVTMVRWEFDFENFTRRGF